MVKLRLKRLGRKNRPFYRLVAIDSRKARDGREIERLGWFNPTGNTDSKMKINQEKVIYWLKEGAQPSDTVKSLLKSQGILYKIHLLNQGISEVKVNEELEKWLKQNADKEVSKKIKNKSKKAAKLAEKAPAAKEAKAEEAPAAEEVKAEDKNK